MERVDFRRIMKTRRFLRDQTIKTVMNQYDGEILGLNKEQRQRKYQKMLKSPFQFYRGSAYLYYFDATQWPFSYHTPENKPTRIQGDLHFENFGAFKNKRGRIVFDTNDFDEGYLGSYIYDVFRMTTSIGLYADEIGYDEDAQKQFISDYLKAYYEQIKQFADADLNALEYSFNETNTQGPVRDILEALKEKQPTEVLQEMTTTENGQRIFAESDRYERMNQEELAALRDAWHEYIDSLNLSEDIDASAFRIKDAAKSFGAGTGSIGLMRYFILIEGLKEDNDDDIVLEAKEARTPAPAHYFTFDEYFTDDSSHHGQRVIETQRAMHYMEDPYLGHFTLNGRHFYVRENTPFEESVDQTQLQTTENMRQTIKVMGQVTAKVHARADEDTSDHFIQHQSEQEITRSIDGDLTGFIKQLTNFSLFYKKQVYEDFDIFTEWCRIDFGLTPTKS